MPLNWDTVAHLGALSARAYSESVNGVPAHVSTQLSGTQWSYVPPEALIAMGLPALRSDGSSAFDAQGYFQTEAVNIGQWTFDAGKAFVAWNQTTGHIAIVFRGTDDTFDFLLDITGFFSGAFDVYSELFVFLIDAVENLVASPTLTLPGQGSAPNPYFNSTIFTAGHSLGGAVAEYWWLASSGSIAGGAGFGSPGIAEDPQPHSDDFVHVTRTDDVIGELREHLAISISIDDRELLPGIGGEAHNHWRYANQLHDIARSSSLSLLPVADDLRIVFLDEQGESIVVNASNADGYAGSNSADSINASSAPAPLVADGFGGNDTLTGSAWGDVLAGGDGVDMLIGGAGVDSLSGGDGGDTINGGAETDYLEGAGGNDLLIGGAGGDYYSIGLNQGYDVIDDQGGDGVDVLRFYGGDVITSLSQVHWYWDANGSQIVFFLDANGIEIARIEIANQQFASGAVEWLDLYAGPNDAFVGSLNLLGGGDAGDTFAEAAITSVPRHSTGSVGFNGDTGDFYTFVAPASGQLTVTLSGFSGDLDLYLYNGAQSELAHSFFSNPEQIAHNVVAGQTYYIEIDPFSSSASNYTLDISLLASFTEGADIVTLLQAQTAHALGGDDEVTGSAGADSIFGGADNDILEGGGGEDSLYGDEGADQLYGGADNDHLDGWTEADAAYGGDGDDVILGWTGDDVLNGGDGDDVLNGEADDDFLDGWTGDDELYGGQGDDTLLGWDGADYLEGGDGADELAGEAGADTMRGGAGDDTYIVDSVSDIVIENSGEGTDTVQTAISYTLSANVERLTLTGSGAVNGAGNALANTIIGNSGNNTLNGGAGADAMIGGLGDDTFIVDNAGDVTTEAAGQGTDTVQSSVTRALSANLENLVLTGAAAINGFGNVLNNQITGNGAANQLNGFDGADILDGGAGNDSMFGGNGDDTYFVDSAGDLTTEVSALGGTDTVFSSVSRNLTAHLENLTLTGAANLVAAGNGLNNALTGNSGSNTLYGFDGNDVLDGGAGADTMFGAAGDDTYYVDQSGDITVEGIVGPAGGVDTVISSISRNMNANFENMILVGAATIAYGNILGNVITGNAQANSLYGFDGNDTLDGGTGADQMFGSNGDDAYIVDNAGDVTAEVSALGGIDTVFSSVSRNLTAHLENLTLTGGADINGAGNGLDNTLIGNAGANTLFGLAGADRLDGGLGADVLQGGADGDTYVFSSALGGGNVDQINGFAVAEDSIELDAAIFTALSAGPLAAGAFTTGAAASEADDRIIYDAATGALYYDPDGAGGAAQIQFATLTAGLALSHSDFIVGGG